MGLNGSRFSCGFAWTCTEVRFLLLVVLLHLYVHQLDPSVMFSYECFLCVCVALQGKGK